MGFFFEGYTLTTVLVLLGLILVLILLNEVTRRSKTMSIIAYCILPIPVFILIFAGVIGGPTSRTWFGMIKAFSALAGVLGFMAIRYTKLGNTKFAGIFPVTILSLNILEAVYREYEVFMNYKTPVFDEAAQLFFQGGYWNILNAVAGILTIVTLTGWMGIKVAKTKSKDMVWPDMLWFYVVGYTLWNFAYVYNCASNRSAYAGLALLLSCGIAELIFKRGAWLQHRAQTLTWFIMFSIALDYKALPAFGITSTNNVNAQIVISIISFAFCVGVFAFNIVKMVKTKRNPVKEDLFVGMKAYEKNLEANKLVKAD